MLESYRPRLLRIEKIRRETGDIKTFFMTFADPEDGNGFSYRPGQFMMLSIIGVGESTFCLTQSPTRPEFIEASIKLAGRVTEEFHSLRPGDVVGFRGPYGNFFDMQSLKGKDIVFVAGGIGMAPVRSALNYCIDNRSSYGHITVIYGARSPRDLSYSEEFDQWRATPDCAVHIAVDPPRPDSPLEGWNGHIGFVPGILKEVAPSCENAACIVCGPPIMIKFSIATLDELGFDGDLVFTTLENRMQCGIGKCGRCNIGHIYVCKDGPVFSRNMLRELPDEL